jgi:hypothetical protein
MDQACKDFWHETMGGTTEQRVDPNEWAIYIGSEKITSHAKRRLADWILTRRAESYWLRKSPPNTVQLIDWHHLGPSMRKMTQARRHWLSKQASDMCASGIQMKRRNQRKSDACPHCGIPEDAEHILCCQAEGVKEIWEDLLQALQASLTANDTAPDIQRDLIEGLEFWRKLSPDARTAYNKNRLATELPPSIGNSMAAKEQHRIGWRSMLEGRIGQAWHDNQRRYLTEQGSQKSPAKWTKSLISELINLSWQLWLHRNDALHRVDQTLADEAIDAAVRKEAERGLEGCIDTRLAHLLNEDIGTILERSTQSKRDWLSGIRACRTRHARESANRRNPRVIMESFVRSNTVPRPQPQPNTTRRASPTPRIRNPTNPIAPRRNQTRLEQFFNAQMPPEPVAANPDTTPLAPTTEPNPNPTLEPPNPNHPTHANPTATCTTSNSQTTRTLNVQPQS